MKSVFGFGLCGALGLSMMTAGCAGHTAAPPTQAQEQQRINSLLNDPHVPDSVKQHLKDQQQANAQAAQAYTTAQQRKQAVGK